MRADATVHARPLPLASMAATIAPERNVRLVVTPRRSRSISSAISGGMLVNAPVQAPIQAPSAIVASDSETQDMTHRQRGDSGLCLHRASETPTIRNGPPKKSGIIVNRRLLASSEILPFFRLAGSAFPT